MIICEIGSEISMQVFSSYITNEMLVKAVTFMCYYPSLLHALLAAVIYSKPQVLVLARCDVLQ